MFKETSRQGVQGVQDISLLAPKPHKQWEDTKDFGNVLRSTYGRSAYRELLELPALDLGRSACRELPVYKEQVKLAKVELS